MLVICWEVWLSKGGMAYLNSSRKSLTLYIVMREVAAAGTMMIGVRERWSEQANKQTSKQPDINQFHFHSAHLSYWA